MNQGHTRAGQQSSSEWPHEKIISPYDQILSLENWNWNTQQELATMQSEVKHDVARKRSGCLKRTIYKTKWQRSWNPEQEKLLVENRAWSRPGVPGKDRSFRHASVPDSTNRCLLRNLSTYYQPPKLWGILWGSRFSSPDEWEGEGRGEWVS